MILSQLTMSNLNFEDSQYTPNTIQPEKRAGLSGWLVRRKIVRNTSQANLALIILAALTLIVSAVQVISLVAPANLANQDEFDALNQPVDTLYE
ncbi:hypothetical protein N9L26_01130 [Candidatus Pacebacteria bacterium]|nr:hypothetical protein [Candidatus Paceibacterota bacterium]